MQIGLQDSESGIMTNEREQSLRQWVMETLHEDAGKITMDMVSGDASFRRYFRVRCGQQEFIAVDAPPEVEDSATFVRIDRLLAEAGVRVPDVINVDLQQGFMLLEDFGDLLYLKPLLDAQRDDDIIVADTLYKQALDSLITIQLHADKGSLGPYDKSELRREMNLFPDWFCEKLLGIQLTAVDKDLISSVFDFLEEAALAQETVFVHRDYHSRNLMCLEQGGPGIIDFQDAVSGPYTYDLVSLLRDCYIQWPQPQIDHWAQYYLAAAQAQGLAGAVAPEQFVRDFDLMGLQRHLKVMGIFSRLFVRDNKSRYLADIPLVIHYFLEVSSRYPELSTFRHWFQESVLPLAEKRLDSATL